LGFHPLVSLSYRWRQKSRVSDTRRTEAKRTISKAMHRLAVVFMLCLLPASVRSIRKAYDDVDLSSFLGSWSSNETKLVEFHDYFINATPYPHVVIENFFAPDVAARIESRFPIPNGTVSSEWIAQGWHVSNIVFVSDSVLCIYVKEERK
jgi:hypothetical protein